MSTIIKNTKKVFQKKKSSLATMAQLFEESSHKLKRKVASSILGQGTCLGWGFGPWLGHL